MRSERKNPEKIQKLIGIYFGIAFAAVFFLGAEGAIAGQCAQCDGGACDGACSAAESADCFGFPACTDIACCADCCPGSCGDFVCETDPSNNEIDPDSPDCCAIDCCDQINCDNFCTGGGGQVCGDAVCELGQGEQACDCAEDCTPADWQPDDGCCYPTPPDPSVAENFCNSPVDCANVGSCGDGCCNPNMEDDENCPDDCGGGCGPTGGFCGDGCCHPDGTENNCNCPADCGPGEGSIQCGDGCCDDGAENPDDCPQDCGPCDEDLCCEEADGEGQLSCPMDCGSCGDLVCDPPSEIFGGCGDCYCGDFICDPGENSGDCPEDCITESHCGDDICEVGDEFCPQDCFCPGIINCENCADLDPCTTDFCDPVFGCDHGPVDCPDDGNLCTFEFCDSEVGCTFSTQICADDGTACNGSVPVCNPSTGVCEDTVPPTSCDDGDNCTTDTCVAGVGCQHTPISCDDGNACNGTETCDPVTGNCSIGTPINCDDNNACTSDSCDSTGCQNTTITCPDDAFACTSADCKIDVGCVQKPNHSFCSYLGPKAKCHPAQTGHDANGCVKK